MNLLNKKFHFIAVGGVGMSALAKYLVERGSVVSGSDINESKYTKLLEQKGVKVTIGHDSNLIQKDMIIVASTAIKNNNPEIIRAKELGLQIYHRSDILKMISDEFSESEKSYFIGFSGTHGKTTTSGLASYVLSMAGFNPSYVVGGIIPDVNTNGAFQGDDFFIAELDESDGTIQKYSTDVAVINNIEEDHLDFYKNGFSDIVKTFNKYLSNKSSQIVVINNDNYGNNQFMKLYPNYNYVTFGFNNADYVAKNVEFLGFGSKFDIYYKNEKIETIKLSVPGIHNVYNALAVFVSMKIVGINTDLLIDSFYSFSGMGRRFQKVCEFNNVKIFDDYAHHPSEIKTTLESVYNAKTLEQRIVAVFQPHRYSRLKGLWDEFKKSFDCADLLLVTDVYSAGEDVISGVDSKTFVNEINHKNAIYVTGSVSNCAKEIYPLINENDIIITLGAGTITQLGKLIEQEYIGIN